MGAEPEALGDRLRRIEEELARLRGDLAHEHGRSSAIDDIVEYVLMPAMVLLAGHGHHQQLAEMVGEAGAAIQADDTIHETLRQARVQHLDDWRRYIEGLPKFQASDWLDRHKAANPEG